jgi:hypothetical protein
VTAALTLLVLLGAVGLIPIPGAAAEIPLPILVAGFAFAFLKLVAASGLWRGQRWAAILGFVVVLLDALTGVPGVMFAESLGLRVYAGVGVIVSIVALTLLATPAFRRAYR